MAVAHMYCQFYNSLDSLGFFSRLFYQILWRKLTYFWFHKKSHCRVGHILIMISFWHLLDTTFCQNFQLFKGKESFVTIKHMSQWIYYFHLKKQIYLYLIWICKFLYKRYDRVLFQTPYQNACLSFLFAKSSSPF